MDDSLQTIVSVAWGILPGAPVLFSCIRGSQACSALSPALHTPLPAVAEPADLSASASVTNLLCNLSGQYVYNVVRFFKVSVVW